MDNLKITIDESTPFLVLAVLRANGQEDATLEDAEKETKRAFILLTSPDFLVDDDEA